jgi:hypothetical protein
MMKVEWSGIKFPEGALVEVLACKVLVYQLWVLLVLGQLQLKIIITLWWSDLFVLSVIIMLNTLMGPWQINVKSNVSSLQSGAQCQQHRGVNPSLRCSPDSTANRIRCSIEPPPAPPVPHHHRRGWGRAAVEEAVEWSLSTSDVWVRLNSFSLSKRLLVISSISTATSPLHQLQSIYRDRKVELSFKSIATHSASDPLLLLLSAAVTPPLSSSDWLIVEAIASSCAVGEHPHTVRSLCPAVHISCCRSFTKVREMMISCRMGRGSDSSTGSAHWGRVCFVASVREGLLPKRGRCIPGEGQPSFRGWDDFVCGTWIP